MSLVHAEYDSSSEIRQYLQNNWAKNISANSIPEVFAQDFGIFPNTGFDIAPALNALMKRYDPISTSNAQKGAKILLSPGIYNVGSTVNVPNQVCVIGAGKRVTSVNALAGFSGTYVFQMGDLTQFAFDTYLQDLGVNASDLAGVGGVNFTQGQEGSCLRSVFIGHFTTYGLNLSDVAFRDANMYFHDLEIYGTSGNLGGIQCLNVGGTTYFDRVTIVSLGASIGTATAPYGISIGNGCYMLSNFHFEGVTSGILMIGNTLTGVAIDINGSSGNLVTNVVDYGVANTLFRVMCITKGSTSTNSLRVALHGATVFTQSFIPDTIGWVNQTLTSSVPALPATPGIIQNGDPWSNLYTITGGVVTLIERIRDQTTSAFYTTGLTAGEFLLAPRDRLRITYTTAPTITVIPFCGT